MVIEPDVLMDRQAIIVSETGSFFVLPLSEFQHLAESTPDVAAEIGSFTCGLTRLDKLPSPGHYFVLNFTGVDIPVADTELLELNLKEASDQALPKHPVVMVDPLGNAYCLDQEKMRDFEWDVDSAPEDSRQRTAFKILEGMVRAPNNQSVPPPILAVKVTSKDLEGHGGLVESTHDPTIFVGLLLNCGSFLGEE